MKYLSGKLFLAFIISFLTVGLWSCMSETPFGNESEGASLVKIGLSMNTTVTRAVENPELESLYKNCVLYISNGTGLLHKWQGMSNIPTSGVYLRYGDYLAEAWAGDSVPASFSSKFYKGETKFSISQNQITTQVSVVCKLANVVTSVDISNLSNEFARNLKVEFTSSDGSLVMEGSSLSQKGYFMRRYDKDSKTYDDVVNYVITGIDINGSPFTKAGSIPGVQPGHEYRIGFEYGEGTSDPVGAAAIQIVVKDYDLVEDDVIIHGKPEFQWLNTDLSIDGQIYAPSGNENEQTLYIAAYRGFQSVSLSTNNPTLQEKLAGSETLYLQKITTSVSDALKNNGISLEWEECRNNTVRYVLTFSKEWFSSLPPSEEEYVIYVESVDDRGLSNSMKIRVANTEEALSAPFTLVADYWNRDYLSVLAHSAKIEIKMLDNEKVSEIGALTIQYRVSGEEEWNEQEIEIATFASDNTVVRKITGLDAGTEYECRIVGGEIVDNDYRYRTDTYKFTTEGEFIIPNAGMENWYKTGKYFVPGIQGQDFWDTGNNGSTTISDNDNLTVQFTGFKHGGTSCAQLTSKYVGVTIFTTTIGKHGAASLFTGSFVSTEQTTHGIIDLGRAYNGSHPKAVRVWVNYRPQKADKGGNDNYIKKGELDKGQIYIALSTEIHRARTYVQSTLITEDNLPSEFIAYGQRTFEEDFGDDNVLEEVIIPFKYFKSANSKSPKYLIILCAASKYGDYFSGGEGSTMYVDDFELIYDDDLEMQ